MNLIRYYFAILLAIVAFSNANAQTVAEPCRDCPLPKHPNTTFTPKDSTLDVYFKDSRVPLYDVRSVKRGAMKSFGKLEQALQIKLLRNGMCFDTLIPLREIEKLSVTGLGLGGQTLNVPVFPAREYYRESGYSASKPNFFEITGNFGYFGKDDSKKEVGIDNIAYGAQALIAPFGNMLGRNVKLALGGGLLWERSRMRIPVMAHVRWIFLNNEWEEEYFNYNPSPCKFGIEGEAPIKNPDATFIEVPSSTRLDSTVYYYQDKKLMRSKFRPYIFGEGGLLFNGSFTGSGKTPSVNPDEYGQYFMGLGVGMPLFDALSLNLSGRWMRLNLRTPCEACGDNFIVNTNKSFGLFLAIGWFVDFR